MSKDSRVLRVAAVYHNSVVRDLTFKSGDVSLGTKANQTFAIPPVGLSEGFKVFTWGGRNHTFRFTDRIKGEVHTKGETKKLVDLVKTAKSVGSIQVADADDAKVAASIYEIPLAPGDWGVMMIGDVELIFQYVFPRGVVASAASFGGATGAIAAIVGGLFSVLGVAVLLSFLVQGSLLFWAFWTDDSQEYLSYATLDERWIEVMTDVEETEEEEELVEEEEPDIDEAGKRAADEEGKFGEEDPEDPETVLPDLDAKMVEKLDKPVGIQAALSSNLLGSGGAQSLFGSGATFGDAMDQVAMSGEGDAFNAGFGYGGMGTMGRGAGGGGTGAGRIGGLADRDTGGGRGSGKGLGQKAKAKVKPKVSFAAPRQEGFCKKDNISDVVKKKASALRNCYERQLLADPQLAGKIVMQWKVGLDGTVKNPLMSSSTMKNEKVEKCMARVIERMRFDKPDGGICVIEFPFSFSPSE